ncbi:hypothetical protein WJX77_002649 [Trebouxia sp. C0004]
MSQGRQRIARLAARRQHTEPVSSPAKVVPEPGLSVQPRKGPHLRAIATAQTTAEPQPFLTDSVSFKVVKQEASTEGTEAVRFVGTEQPVKPPRARKRKQPEAHDHAFEPDASNVLAPTAAAADGKQHVTASRSPHAVRSPQSRAKPAKGKNEDVTLLSDAADVVQQAALSVAEPVSNPAKSPKQQKPRAKAVIKSKIVAETEPAGAAPSAQHTEPTKDAATIADTSLGKPCKQRKPKTIVKTETMVKEDLASPDASAAALSDESAKKSKPRKPRAKKVLTVEQLLDSVDVVPYRERVIPKKWVGAHVSMGGGLERAVVRAASIGANAFALDTRSKRQWESKPIEVDTADKFKQACKDYGFGPEHILPHGSYLINLASADPALLSKSYNAFVDELKRCEILGIRLYNFHPGSTCGKCPPEEGMDRIAEQINKAHTETKSVIVVLENMAGAGGSVGHKFEYLRHIIDRVEAKARVGVCLDTCHLFAGGYDVSSPETFEQVMAEFEEVVGLQYLKGMHVNDSKAALGSKKDRHENVAKGLIGKDCFSFLMNDDRFNGIPLIMETPVQCEGPHIDYKLSLLAGGPVYKGPSEAETGINTDKRDIAWLNSLSRD